MFRRREQQPETPSHYHRDYAEVMETWGREFLGEVTMRKDRGDSVREIVAFMTDTDLDALVENAELRSEFHAAVHGKNAADRMEAIRKAKGFDYVNRLALGIVFEDTCVTAQDVEILVPAFAMTAHGFFTEYRLGKPADGLKQIALATRLLLVDAALNRSAQSVRPSV